MASVDECESGDRPNKPIGMSIVKIAFRNYCGANKLSRMRKEPHKRDDPRQGGRRRRSSCISPGGSG